MTEETEERKRRTIRDYSAALLVSLAWLLVLTVSAFYAWVGTNNRKDLCHSNNQVHEIIRSVLQDAKVRALRGDHSQAERAATKEFYNIQLARVPQEVDC